MNKTCQKTLFLVSVLVYILQTIVPKRLCKDTKKMNFHKIALLLPFETSKTQSFTLLCRHIFYRSYCGRVGSQIAIYIVWNNVAPCPVAGRNCHRTFANAHITLRSCPELGIGKQTICKNISLRGILLCLDNAVLKIFLTISSLQQIKFNFFFCKTSIYDTIMERCLFNRSILNVVIHI